MDVLGSIRNVSTFFLLLTIVAIIIFCIAVFSEGKQIKKMVIAILSFLFLLFFSLSIFIPKQETMTKMLIASQVTSENYEFAKDEIVDLVDYIIEKIDGNEEVN